MGQSIILVRENKQHTMTTQVISYFGDRGNLGTNSCISISTEYGSSKLGGGEFSSAEFASTEFESADFSLGPQMKPSVNRMSALKKLSGIHKIASKVAWDDTASLGSSLRSSSEKTFRNEIRKKPAPKTGNERRRPSIYEDFSSVTTSKLVKSLKKYDDELDDILRIQTPEAIDPIIAVNKDHLQKINILGRGQFCNVFSVAGSLPMAPNGEEHIPRKKRIFALKSIDPKRVKDEDEMIIAASDLASEAKILSGLDHKNIIKLRGLCCESFSKSFVDETSGRSASQKGFGGRDGSRKSFRDFSRDFSLKNLNSFKISKPTNGIEGYFLLLDVLTEVLSDRLAKQRSQKAQSCRPMEKSQRKLAMYDRIEHIVMGIVDGMRYLHSQDIVLRDLKPGNVGLDENMNVRLFDFGMARNISECEQNEICGSPRYMAPEIMKGEGYTLKVDVYSFGILLYELCALEIPFANSCMVMKLKQKKKLAFLNSIFKKKPRASKKANAIHQEQSQSDCGLECPKANLLLDFYRRVVHDELRPSNNNLDTVIPCSDMRILIKECWSTDPERRPSFDDIATRLEAIFNSH